MNGLAALAVSVLGSVAAAAPASPGPVHATMTPERPQVILGVDRELTLTIEVKDNDGAIAFAPERALASVGTIAAVTPAGRDRFRVRYLAPATRFPQVSIIVVDLVGDGQHLRATARLPLHGATQMPFHTSANAMVSVRVQSQSFGPVRADAQGNVAIPIVVPPGVRVGSARATDVDGNTRETTVDLQPAPFEQILIVATPPFEVGAFAEVSTFAVNRRGEPLGHGTITLRASEGMVHPMGQGSEGEERFLVEAPRRLGGGSLRLVATAIEAAPEPVVVIETRAEIVVPLVAGPPQRLLLSSSVDHLIIGESRPATLVLAARDRHDNPASCAGARLTVDRHPVPLVAGPPGCGRLVVAVPDKPGPGGTLEVEAVLGTLRARTTIRVSPAPAVKLTAGVSAPQVVGDGRQSIEVRVDGFDRVGKPAPVPNLRWQAAGGRLGPVRSPRDGTYVSQFTPAATRTPRVEVLVVKGDPLLSATTVVRVTPTKSRLSLSARVGLFSNFGGMAGPVASIEALRSLPGSASGWAAGIVVSYLHSDMTPTATGEPMPPESHLEIDQLPLLAIVRYRLPIPLGAHISLGGGAGVSLARTVVRWHNDVWPPTPASVRAPAAELHTEVAFPLAPGELVVGAHYLWIDLGRTSQGDTIRGNSVGFVGDIGFRMAW
jgi:hypothetical protein